jgi:hypothetical protein
MEKQAAQCGDGGTRDGNGLSWSKTQSVNKYSRVEFDTWTRTHEWNLAPEPESVGFRVTVGFYKCDSFWECLDFYLFFFGFQVPFEFFGFLSGFFWVHPQVKNETRTWTWFYAGSVGVKINLNPHLLGLKPVGDPKPELSSLGGTELGVEGLSGGRERRRGRGGGGSDSDDHLEP